MKNTKHIFADLEAEITRLKNKNRNYKQACKHLTKAYDTVRGENAILRMKLVSPPEAPARALKIAA